MSADWVTFGVTVCGGLVVAALLAVVLSRQRHGLPEIDEGMLGAEATRSVPACQTCRGHGWLYSQGRRITRCPVCNGAVTGEDADERQ